MSCNAERKIVRICQKTGNRTVFKYVQAAVAAMVQVRNSSGKPPTKGRTKVVVTCAIWQALNGDKRSYLGFKFEKADKDASKRGASKAPPLSIKDSFDDSLSWRDEDARSGHNDTDLKTTIPLLSMKTKQEESK